MAKVKDKQWLSNQISDARKNLDSLPTWVKKAARFEGSDNRSYVSNGRNGTARKGTKSAG
jgi:hypothetical protein